MRNSNLKVLSMLLIIVFFILFNNNVFAKYIPKTSSFLIIETNLDRTAPKLSITYSTTAATNGDVVATIKANEKIQSVSGWTLSSDKLTLTKTYSSNTTTSISVYDLVGNKSTANISITNIDKTAPVVTNTSITNSNTGYTSYANSSKEINLTIKLTDNVAIKTVDLSKIAINVGSSTADLTKAWTKTSTATKEIIYNLKLTNIKGNGTLKLIFGKGFIIDTASNSSIQTEIDTKITIDNVKPTITYSQSVIDDGKVKAILTANEKVQKLNGWNISSDSKQLNKQFVSNVSYELTISDLAGNSNIVTVNVTGATYINLIYASHNSVIGWSYGHGNYDIAGKEAVLTSPLYKTEALAFNIRGNISNDFVKGRAYLYSYWGSGSQARCNDSGLVYNYGYNPSSTSWKTMASSDLVTISGKQYFQFGASRFQDKMGEITSEQQRELGEIDESLKELMDRKKSLEKADYKHFFSKMKNKRDLKKVVSRINKLKTKQGRIKSSQKRIVDIYTSKYVKKMEREFNKFVREQERISVDFQRKQNQLVDLNEKQKKMERLSRKMVSNEEKRAKANKISQVSLDGQNKVLESRQKMLQSRIDSLKGKVGSVELSKQYSTTFTREYAYAL